MEIAKILDLTPKSTAVKEESCQKATQALDEIKEMNIHLDKVRSHLEDSVRVCQAEEVKVKDFSKELEQLHRERLAHVEQLRHIHADISTLEAAMKRAEEEKAREFETAQYLYQGYVNLLKHVNVCRQALGFESLPQHASTLLNSELDFSNRCDSQFDSQLLTTSNTDYSHAPRLQASDTPPQLHQAALFTASFAKSATAHMFSSPLLMSTSSALSHGHPAASFRHSHSLMPPPLGQFSAASGNFLRCTSSSFSSPSVFCVPPSFLNQQLQMRSSPVTPTDLLGESASFPTSTGNPMSNRNLLHSPSSFRQQPPPMKACLSCHQQIHRNAPICPLCKAKSRSKNPKKLKKKSSNELVRGH